MEPGQRQLTRNYSSSLMGSSAAPRALAARAIGCGCMGERGGAIDASAATGVKPSRWVRTLAGSSSPALYGAPSWSPDSHRIVFVQAPGTTLSLGDDADFGGSVYAVNADGSGLTRLTEGPDSYPAWSPDGAQIAFSRLSADGSWAGIFAMDPSGQNVHALLAAGVADNFDGGLDWSRAP